jgi:hypothetical protein
LSANRCGVCRRETESKTGYCYRAECNAARLRAIRLGRKKELASLKAELAELRLHALSSAH